MPKIKVSESSGPVLDWLVAKCEGLNLDTDEVGEFSYSTDWAQGGPIIEREKLFVFTGPTPLITAMRCYVANKFGDEVEVPEGLQ